MLGSRPVAGRRRLVGERELGTITIDHIAPFHFSLDPMELVAVSGLMLGGAARSGRLLCLTLWDSFTDDVLYELCLVCRGVATLASWSLACLAPIPMGHRGSTGVASQDARAATSSTA